MPRSERAATDEKSLTKGELRKLNALKKSIGDQLGNETFAKWYAQNGQEVRPNDPNAVLIENALNPLIKKIRIPPVAPMRFAAVVGLFVEPVELKG